MFCTPSTVTVHSPILGASGFIQFLVAASQANVNNGKF